MSVEEKSSGSDVKLRRSCRSKEASSKLDSAEDLKTQVQDVMNKVLNAIESDGDEGPPESGQSPEDLKSQDIVDEPLNARGYGGGDQMVSDLDQPSANLTTEVQDVNVLGETPKATGSGEDQEMSELGQSPEDLKVQDVTDEAQEIRQLRRSSRRKREPKSELTPVEALKTQNKDAVEEDTTVKVIGGVEGASELNQPAEDLKQQDVVDAAGDNRQLRRSSRCPKPKKEELDPVENLKTQVQDVVDETPKATESDEGQGVSGVNKPAEDLKIETIESVVDEPPVKKFRRFERILEDQGVSEEDQAPINNILSSNPSIMDLVFNQVQNVDDLNACRLVCRLWNCGATPLLLKNIHFCEVQFRFMEDKYETMMQNQDSEAGKEFLEVKKSGLLVNGGLNKGERVHRTHKVRALRMEQAAMLKRVEGGVEEARHRVDLSLLPEYLEYLGTDPDLVFTNFYFQNLQMTDELVVDFLNKCGTTLKQLDLNLSNKLTPPIYMEPGTFLEILGKCPNVEELIIRSLPVNVLNSFNIPKFTTKIKTLHIYSGFLGLGGNSTGFLKSLLRVCPLLEGLYCPGGEEEGFEGTTRDGKVLSALSKLKGNNLKELSLDSVNQNILTKYLIPLGNKLKLKFLKFQKLDVADVHKELEQFLSTQKESLESFFIFDWHLTNWDRLEETVKFPVMPKLELLRIGGAYAEIMMKLTPVNWISGFPSLKNVMLNGSGEYADVILSRSTMPHEKVTGLELPIGLSLTQMRYFRRTFPNVKELIVSNTSDKCLREIWTLWEELESLFICINSSEDPTETEEPEEYLPLDVLFTGGEGEQNIANLKKLRELTIHPGPLKDELGGNQRADKVTDKCVREGLSKLSQLHYLFIGTHEITAEGAEYLCKSIPGLRLNEYPDKRFQYQRDYDYKPHPLLHIDAEAKDEK